MLTLMQLVINCIHLESRFSTDKMLWGYPQREATARCSGSQTHRLFPLLCLQEVWRPCPMEASSHATKRASLLYNLQLKAHCELTRGKKCDVHGAAAAPITSPQTLKRGDTRRNTASGLPKAATQQATC